VTRPRAISRFLVIAAIACGVASSSLADEEAFKIIVHPDNPITSLDRDDLRGAYLKKTTLWGNGKAIRPIQLPKDQPVRERFTRSVLKKTPSQLKSFWTQQIFSGKGVPPPEARSPAAAIAYVLANPGAVAYLPVNVDPRGAKVITLR
jgi:ABC-type phosphate transport system substrate-binding protein